RESREPFECRRHIDSGRLLCQGERCSIRSTMGGEGNTLFWFNGKAHWAELYAHSVHKGTDGYPWDVLSIPQTEWWVKVRTQSGALGWISAPDDLRERIHAAD